MQQKTRPLSPHLSIYKPQISSVMSILHRITGVANFLGTMVFLWWIIYYISSRGDADFSPQALLQCWLVVAFLMGWTYTLWFHLATGIRHLFWDAGFGFKVSTANKTGWLAFLMASLGWLLMWCYLYF